MRHDQVTYLLQNYRCYEYASVNCGRTEYPNLPVMLSERTRNPDTWDWSRYNRIVNIVKGAVDHVLSDDQRMVIMRKYMDRNTKNISEIADEIHRDRTTVSRWHKEAIRRLAIALEPLNDKETEITNFDHMFDRDWIFRPTA